MNEPKVSVVIPVYNVEKHIDKCLESILNQTYKNLEIILCDDLSSDNSLKKLYEYEKKDSRIIVLKNDSNLKAGETRNKCIRKATGKYVAVQDADDYSDYTRIEKQVKVLEEREEIAFVSTAMYRYNEDGIWGEYYPWNAEPTNKDFLWGLPYVHGTTMFRREALKKVEGYKPGKNNARTEDFDLLLRLHIAGFRGANILEKLYYYNENIDAYMRREYKYRIQEAKMRWSAYKELKLMPIGVIFAIKPLIVGLIPRKIQYSIRKKTTKKDTEKENIKRVLQVVSRPHLGGVETMLMNVYRNIDKSKVQFDFTNHDKEAGKYEEEILNLGGKIQYIEPIRRVGVIKYIKGVKKLVKENNYDIVHSHISINNSLVLLGAMLGGAKIRISHAHTTTTEKPNTLKYNIATDVMKLLNKLVATKYCACGKLAGEFLYGKRCVNKGKVIVVNNGVDVDKFKEYYGRKDEIRTKYKLPCDKIIIGHIGRFDGPVKNHKYIFEIISTMKKQKKLDKYLFVFVGDGEALKKYKEFSNKENLSDNIIFFGTTNDIPEIIQTFDFLILPSLYEGLPVVTIESQAAGIMAIVSDKVTKEIDLGLGLIQFVGIDIENINDWIYNFENNSSQELDYTIIDKKMDEKGYSIKSSINTFYSLYNEEV